MAPPRAGGFGSLPRVAMFKFVSSLVGAPASTSPFEYGEAQGGALGGWQHFRGTRSDGEPPAAPVSIWRLEGSSAADPRLAAARNALRRLRGARHPNILSFVHGVEAADGPAGPATAVIVVTEPVTPLLATLADLGLAGRQRDDYLAWGLQQVRACLRGAGTCAGGGRGTPAFPTGLPRSPSCVQFLRSAPRPFSFSLFLYLAAKVACASRSPIFQ